LVAVAVAAVVSRWFFVLRRAQAVMPAVAVRAKAAVLVLAAKAVSAVTAVLAVVAVVQVQPVASLLVRVAMARCVS
jgi:hypothetical protein